MEEIKAGEYIRTDNGEIAKVIYNATNEFCYKEMLALDRVVSVNNSEFIYRDDIVKHSKNIIDLIEVGDIVKVYVFADISDDDSEAVETYYRIESKYEITELKESVKMNYVKILSILTKEIYEREAYKIE